MRFDFCVACGRKSDLHDHHLLPRGLDGPDIETNVITLCGDCHNIIHDRDVRWNELLKTGRERALAAGIKFGRKPKLTPDQRQEAMRRRAKGETLASIADSYGVHLSQISRLAA
jgi:hypothetical protein